MKLIDLKNMAERPPVVVSYGGGTDSTAMILACYERQVPIDYIIFADTGGEKPNTYDYLKLFNVWLRAHNMPEITVVQKKESLYDRTIRYKSLPSIAFGHKQCSVTYKMRPIDSFVNQQMDVKIARQNKLKVARLIGYDAGESRRIKTHEDEKNLYFFPLIEWHLTREDCKLLIKKHGLPQPGKSSCFFCPMNKKKEILELKDRFPDLLEKALFMEQNAIYREGTGTKGLGRRYRWKDLIEEHEYTLKLATLFDEELPCGCYDGD